MSVFVRDNLRVLYVHVPKTGGTSVEQFFAKNGFAVSFVDRGHRGSLVPMMKCSPQHLHAEVLHAIFHTNRFSYAFMTVRHPVDRLLSEYRMRAAVQKSIEDVDTWIAEALTGCARNAYHLDNHLRPQVEFWFAGCEVYRQEDGFGTAWADTIATKLGCEISHRGVDVAMRYADVSSVAPNAASIARIEAFYRQDFEFFGYGPMRAT